MAFSKCPECGFDDKACTYYRCKKCGQKGHVSANTFTSNSCISGTQSCPNGGTHDLQKIGDIKPNK
jgi:hypothetical protein